MITNLEESCKCRTGPFKMTLDPEYMRVCFPQMGPCLTAASAVRIPRAALPRHGAGAVQ